MKPRPKALTACLVVAFACGVGAAQAQAPAQTPSAVSPPQQSGPAHAHFHDLLTPEEHRSFHERMHNARTREERRQVRDAMRKLVEERAKERGVMLPPHYGYGPSRYGAGPGAGPRAGFGPEPGSARGTDDGWGRLYNQLLTPEERDRHREQMRNAQTAEERAKLWMEERALVERRAKEKGIPLPDRGPGMAGAYAPGGPPDRGPGYGPGERRGYGPGMGMGMGMGRGPGHHMGRGPGHHMWGGPYGQLFTEEERVRFRDQMRSAQTPEERAKLWAEQRALAEQRAKEKGMTLPPDRGPGRYDPGRGPGGRAASGWGGPYAALFSAEERDAFHAQMRSARTLEERRKLWSEHRALAEQRAKEKGITLPPDRGPGGGPGYGREYGRGPGPGYGMREPGVQTPASPASPPSNQSPTKTD